MEDFERQLKNALARRNPPAGFEAKVLAAAAGQSQARRSAWRWGGFRWAAALAGVVVVITGIAWQRERAVHERLEGEAARARLELALRITSEKLNRIQQKVEGLR